jgi:hypothetical protein
VRRGLQTLSHRRQRGRGEPRHDHLASLAAPPTTHLRGPSRGAVHTRALDVVGGQPKDVGAAGAGVRQGEEEGTAAQPSSPRRCISLGARSAGSPLRSKTRASFSSPSGGPGELSLACEAGTWGWVRSWEIRKNRPTDAQERS